jgi:hypothetical protein
LSDILDEQQKSFLALIAPPVLLKAQQAVNGDWLRLLQLLLVAQRSAAESAAGRKQPVTQKSAVAALSLETRKVVTAGPDALREQLPPLLAAALERQLLKQQNHHNHHHHHQQQQQQDKCTAGASMERQLAQQQKLLAAPSSAELQEQVASRMTHQLGEDLYEASDPLKAAAAAAAAASKQVAGSGRTEPAAAAAATDVDPGHTAAIAAADAGGGAGRQARQDFAPSHLSHVIGSNANHHHHHQQQQQQRSKVLVNLNQQEQQPRAFNASQGSVQEQQQLKQQQQHPGEYCQTDRYQDLLQLLPPPLAPASPPQQQQQQQGGHPVVLTWRDLGHVLLPAQPAAAAAASAGLPYGSSAAANDAPGRGVSLQLLGVENPVSVEDVLQQLLCKQQQPTAAATGDVRAQPSSAGADSTGKLRGESDKMYGIHYSL